MVLLGKNNHLDSVALHVAQPGEPVGAIQTIVHTSAVQTGLVSGEVSLCFEGVPADGTLERSVPGFILALF